MTQYLCIGEVRLSCSIKDKSLEIPSHGNAMVRSLGFPYQQSGLGAAQNRLEFSVPSFQLATLLSPEALPSFRAPGKVASTSARTTLLWLGSLGDWEGIREGRNELPRMNSNNPAHENQFTVLFPTDEYLSLIRPVRQVRIYLTGILGLRHRFRLK